MKMINMIIIRMRIILLMNSVIIMMMMIMTTIKMLLDELANNVLKIISEHGSTQNIGLRNMELLKMN